MARYDTRLVTSLSKARHYMAETPAEDGYKKNLASDLHINFLINTTPDFTLGVLMDETTGDNISLNGTGVIRATYYNKGAFQIFGNYNVSRGAYNLTIQNIIKRQFAFDEGSLIAFGGDPLCCHSRT